VVTETTAEALQGVPSFWERWKIEPGAPVQLQPEKAFCAGVMESLRGKGSRDFEQTKWRYA
jgi:hypothetical protein